MFQPDGNSSSKISPALHWCHNLRYILDYCCYVIFYSFSFKRPYVLTFIYYTLDLCGQTKRRTPRDSMKRFELLFPTLLFAQRDSPRAIMLDCFPIISKSTNILTVIYSNLDLCGRTNIHTLQDHTKRFDLLFL